MQVILENKSKIGSILKKVRVDNNLNQKQIADLLCVDQTTVSGWERGYREPTFDMIEKFCNVCGCNILFIMNSEEVLTTSNIFRKI